jgi:RecB family exonuclease
MGTYDKCPKKYHYHYIEKPEIPKQDWSHLEFGKCLHRALELFHLKLMSEVVSPHEYSVVMRNSFIKALSEFDKELLKPELPAAKDILQKYLDNMYRDGLPNVVSVELPFNFDFHGVHLKGFIDRIDKVGEGKYKVVDYKTNKNPKYLNNFQLLLYAIAIKNHFPDAKEIAGAYVLLRHDCKTMDWVFKESDIKKTTDKILEIGNDIETNVIWEKKPSALCNWCDYKNICQNSWV